MKLVFASNFLNHHQLPLCLELNHELGPDFSFVATQQLPNERAQLGYADMSHRYQWAINSHVGEEEEREAWSRVKEADVLLMGDAPEWLAEERARSGSLTFRYNERIFKKAGLRLVDPRPLASYFLRHTLQGSRNVHLLSAGAYAAADFRSIGAYRGRAYKWGYFPEFLDHDLESLFLQKGRAAPSLLWVGRLIEWKHPEHAVSIARVLRDAGFDFVLSIVGVGPMGRQLVDEVRTRGLGEHVHFLNALTPEEVRRRMESADVLLMTSDRGEGWGAVVNEGMNSACAVVASHLAGSVPYLIQHGDNGLIYRSGDWRTAAALVGQLLYDRALTRRIGSAAYATIESLWNPRIAASRLLYVCNSLLSGRPFAYPTGPCSVA